MMELKQGGKIDNLRISVTQRCNLKCPYCHKEGQPTPSKEISLEEIEKAADVAAESGIKKIKITGGEPLLRKDIVEIVSILKNKGFEDISMVTNGSLLPKYAQLLKNAGLDRINIGCDSLTSDFIKGKDNMIEGLLAAKEAKLQPIKINMVVLRDINSQEIPDMIEFAKKQGVTLQLIELINTDEEYFKKHFFSLETLENELRKKADTVQLKHMHNREVFHVKGVQIELVRPAHKKFCRNCARIRLTSDGKLKPCLMRNDNLLEFEGKESFDKAIELKLEQIKND